ncbi:CBF/Mak21 family-domain-containing protein [Jimgerdemannia flammicorona]|uniref:CBF/Mak21 family-domain-containing protein n=1 Tax=Jimgerdemannia flammicorona TaxID=994334 RepID=A0A433QRG2_9FUNG|nr:CBF/Mak21 family-domain-containing protein [Jimgerdemannia flammicorona]
MPQPLKKRKRAEPSADSEKLSELKQLVAKVKELEQGVAASKANLNNIVSLLELSEVRIQLLSIFCKSTVQYYLTIPPFPQIHNQHDHPKVIHASLHALHRVFTPFLAKGELQRPKKQPTADDKKVTVTFWLRDNYVRYVNQLCKLLQHNEPGLQLPALNVLLDLLRVESSHLTLVSKSHHFANDHYARVVEAVLANPNFSQPLQAEFVDKYINVYDDLRYYFFKDAALADRFCCFSKLITTTLETGKLKNGATAVSKKKKTIPTPAPPPIPSSFITTLTTNAFAILENIRTMPTSESEIDEFWTGHPDPMQKSESSIDDSGFASSDSEGDDPTNLALAPKKKPPLLQLLVHRRALSDCWLAFLRLPLPSDVYKKTLLIVHKRIMPHMPQPTLLMDFLTDSYNTGGWRHQSAGVERSLHPDHRTQSRLSGLLSQALSPLRSQSDARQISVKILPLGRRIPGFHVREFVSLHQRLHTHLPATLVAAFIKRMSRLSLTSPPAGIVILIPMMYNLLKRHPTCMALIHRTEVAAGATGDDPYDFDEPDPYKANALASSLWEVQTLQEHYYPNVATLAKIFSEQFTKPSYNLEDFLDHTYATFFETEMTRKRKNPPAMAFEVPDYLFPIAPKTINEDAKAVNGKNAAEEEDADEVVGRWAVWAF